MFGYDAHGALLLLYSKLYLCTAQRHLRGTAEKPGTILWETRGWHGQGSCCAGQEQTLAVAAA